MTKKAKTSGNIKFKQRSRKRRKSVFQWSMFLKATLVSSLIFGAIWGFLLLKETSLRLWQHLPLSSHATIDEIQDIMVQVVPQIPENTHASILTVESRDIDLAESIRQALWKVLKNKSVDKRVLTRAANSIWKENTSIERLSLVESSLGQIVA
jgi:hypothetical protein